jgi:hypothetical protein
VLDGDVPPGQGRELAVGGRLVGLDHGDVVGLFGFDEPGDVRPDRVQSVEGHDRAGQVQWCQQRLEVCRLVRLRADLGLGEGHDGAVGDCGEQVPSRRFETGRPLECFAVDSDHGCSPGTRGAGPGGGAVSVGQVGTHCPVQGVTVNSPQYAPDCGRRRGAPPSEQVAADADGLQQCVCGTLAPLREFVDAPGSRDDRTGTHQQDRC